MTAPRQLHNSRNERVLLSDELGRGGEGAVYGVAGDLNTAAKIYLGGRANERRAKILAMVSGRWAEKSPSVAFPIDALFDGPHFFVGFTMRRIGGQKPIHSLYSPTSRKNEFPKASFRFLVRVALNIAKSVANVHATGCVIGDINHSGILVAEDATVTLIDCDSFQVATPHEVFHCKVAVPEFTPPELQGRHLAYLVRTPNHDAFGLAILLFNLLFMGRHPFAGRYAGKEDMSMERAITECRFAYSSRISETGMSPPPNVPTLSDLPDRLAAAFETSFGKNGVAGQRPTSSDWVSLLTEAEQQIVQCTKSVSHQYFAKSKSCPWCAMESAYPGFIAFANPVTKDTTKPVDIGQLIAAINAVQDPGNVARLTETMPRAARAQSARALFAGATRQYRIGLLISLSSLELFFLPWPSSVFGFGLFGFGIWHAFRERGALDVPRKAKAEIEKAIQNIELSWSRVSDNQVFLKAKSETSNLVREFQGLQAEESQRLSDLKNKIEIGQRRRFLEQFYIEKASIKGVGASRKITLESYGIETAADVDEHRILGISGFGPATASAIMAWRRTVESRFRYNPAQGVDPKDILAVKSEIARRRTECQYNLNKQYNSLREQSQRVLQARQQLKTAAKPIWERLQTVEDEINTVKATLPSSPQRWIFGVAVVAILYVLTNLNHVETKKTVSVVTPSPVVKKEQPVSVPTVVKQPPAAPQIIQQPPFGPKSAQPLSPLPTTPSEPITSVEKADDSSSSPATTRQLLDLRNRKDVAWVQGRLEELGYLKSFSLGTLDGNTVAALRDFKATMNGRVDDGWDGATQTALQSSSALKMKDSFLGSWSEGTVCRNKAEPEITITNRSARSSSGGACLFRSIQVTRPGWDIRTSCTTGVEQWTATVQFSISGEYLFWRGRDGSMTRYARC